MHVPPPVIVMQVKAKEQKRLAAWKLQQATMAAASVAASDAASAAASDLAASAASIPTLLSQTQSAAPSSVFSSDCAREVSVVLYIVLYIALLHRVLLHIVILYCILHCFILYSVRGGAELRWALSSIYTSYENVSEHQAEMQFSRSIRRYYVYFFSLIAPIASCFEVGRCSECFCLQVSPLTV